MEISQRKIAVLQECLELLQAIHVVEYHNKNWLPIWAIKKPGELNRECRALIERAIRIVGSSSGQPFS